MVLLSLVRLVLANGLSEFQYLASFEADAIILAQEATKAEQKAARIAELEEATVLSEGQSVLPSGQQVIIRKVAPPIKEAAKSVEPKPTQIPTLSPGQIAQWQRRADKESQVIMLSATVYDEAVSRLSWRLLGEGSEYVAYANLDFNLLRGVHQLETGTHDLTFFLAVGDKARSNNPYRDEHIPPLTDFSTDQSEYVLLEGDPDDSAALAGIEALLAYHDAHLPELKIEYQRREALNAARKRYDEQNPKEPEPFIIQFWIPETAKAASE